MPTSVAGNTEEESNRITDVTHDEFDGERRIVDVEISSPPCEKPVGQPE